MGKLCAIRATLTWDVLLLGSHCVHLGRVFWHRWWQWIKWLFSLTSSLNDRRAHIGRHTWPWVIPCSRTGWCLGQRSSLMSLHAQPVLPFSHLSTDVGQLTRCQLDADIRAEEMLHRPRLKGTLARKPEPPLPRMRMRLTSSFVAVMKNEVARNETVPILRAGASAGRSKSQS